MANLYKLYLSLLNIIYWADTCYKKTLSFKSSYK